VSGTILITVELSEGRGLSLVLERVFKTEEFGFNSEDTQPPNLIDSAVGPRSDAFALAMITG
jgi:hypothetical protein